MSVTGVPNSAYVPNFNIFPQVVSVKIDYERQTDRQTRK